LVVTPYFKQVGTAGVLGHVAADVQAGWLEGSGAK